MAIPDFDPRQGGGFTNFMAKKFCSVIVGYVSLVLWIISFFVNVIKPSTTTAMVKNMDAKATAIEALICLTCAGFSVILLFGLHKDRRIYVKIYSIFVPVFLVFLFISFICNLFIQPREVGFQGFFSMFIYFVLHLMFFFVVRSYFLITYCNSTRQQASNQLKV